MNKQDPNKRKQAPAVEKEEDEALPAKNNSDLAHAKTAASAPLKKSEVPEPKNWAQKLAYNKLQYGQRLIGWCLFLIVALTLLDYFFSRNSSAISNTIELLKLVTTTALGFVFARTLDAGKGSED
jgi:hypothetical protein